MHISEITDCEWEFVNPSGQYIQRTSLHIKSVCYRLHLAKLVSSLGPLENQSSPFESGEMWTTKIRKENKIGS